MISGRTEVLMISGRSEVLINIGQSRDTSNIDWKESKDGRKKREQS
jgi:hypothetical protein